VPDGVRRILLRDRRRGDGGIGHRRRVAGGILVREATSGPKLRYSFTEKYLLRSPRWAAWWQTGTSAKINSLARLGAAITRNGSLACAISADSGGASFEVILPAGSPPSLRSSAGHGFGGAHRSGETIRCRPKAPFRARGRRTRESSRAHVGTFFPNPLPEVEQDWLRRSKGSSVEEAISPRAKHRSRADALRARSARRAPRRDGRIARRQGIDGARARKYDAADAQGAAIAVESAPESGQEKRYIFCCSGVSRSATSYEVHRDAYLGAQTRTRAKSRPQRHRRSRRKTSISS